MLLSSVALGLLVFQTTTPATSVPANSTRAVATVSATRASAAPEIDGRENDEVWRLAIPIREFREFQPREDADPRFVTEAKVAYDEHNFYVFVRAFDPRPDSILPLLARRDVRTASDQLKIIIDSYHDRRTGYEFAVNPAGVKRDYAIYNDNQEDDAWDAIWEAAARIDSVGWTAEFRIPLSQLRYAHRPSNTFGFGVWRDIQRYSERTSWPVYITSRSGLASQLGEVTGLDGLAAPTRLEISPYTVTKNVQVEVAENDFERHQRITAGADIKWGITSNITVDATVNPDFGQVEADPSVLNLSAFETFFQERRPFFIEGTGIFRFGVNCNVVNCSGEGLFYSRRVGRSPQIGAYADATSPTATTIIGAAKLTGRLPGGLTIGFLDAVTNRERGSLKRTIEPMTNYAAVRLQQDFRKGETGIGFMGTAVNRNLDQWTEAGLRKSAYVGAFDFRHRFAKGRYQLSGSLDFSRVAGSPEAITATQLSSVHLFQRPDGDLTVDSTRTSLGGSAQEILFRKMSGFIQFETSFQRRSAGFEINDLGFLRRADQQNWSTWGSLNWVQPKMFFRRAFWNFNWWQYWTTAGLALERAANTNAHVQLKNHWWLHAGGTIGQLGETFCDRCARGGPAVRLDRYIAPWAGFEGDDRNKIIPYFFVNYFVGNGGRSVSTSLDPSFDLRLASRFRASIGMSFSNSRDDAQFFGIFDTAGTHYTFAHLEQHTTSMSWRMDYTLTPDLTIQLYASPFITKGTYSNVRELADPRADRYQDRFAAYGDTAVTNNPGGFNFKQFRSNIVVRWEYRPGSTIFLVWGQGRERSEDVEGTRTVRQDMGRLFGAHPDNSFLIKVSYWLSR
jgi:hypothetical protein